MEENAKVGVLKLTGRREFIETVLTHIETQYKIIESSIFKKNEKNGYYHRFATILERGGEGFD